MTIEQHIAAAVDLGSNTFRLLVAACAPGTMRVLEKQLVTVRLGRRLEQNHVLTAHSMEKGLATLRSFRRVLDRYQPQRIRVCGTEALRQALNSRTFLLRAKEILKTEVDIISGGEEARLSLSGVLKDWEDVSGSFLLVDVGGGSTELIYSDADSGVRGAESLGLGVVGLTEKFLAEPLYDLEAMDSFLADSLSHSLNKLQISGKLSSALIIGCGGSATSLAALDLNLNSYNESLVHGYILHTDNMQQLWNKMTALPAAERNELPCLGEGRGEILPAGLRIYQTLLKLLQQKRIRVSDTGLLEGILLSSIPDIP